MQGTVSSKGQLVIPAKIRRKARLSPGMRVRFEIIKGGIAIYPEFADDIDGTRSLPAGLNPPPGFDLDDDPKTP